MKAISGGSSYVQPVPIGYQYEDLYDDTTDDITTTTMANNDSASTSTISSSTSF